MRRTLTIVAIAALFPALLASGARASKPVKVWEDAAGDAEISGNQLPPLSMAGFDLTGGTIARNGANLEFTVTHSAMPASRTPPEAFRFLWVFAVDGESYRFTVKSADVGKPDVIQGQTTERVGRVDVNGHFRLEGECTTMAAGVSFINCKPLAYLEGAWDPASSSFKVVLPMELVEAKTKSVITAGGGDAAAICGICWVTHAAERSSNAVIIDSAAMAKSYRVPKS